MSDLVQSMVNRPPAVVLVSTDFPLLDGASGIRRLRQMSPSTKIIVVSRSINEQEELDMLRAGAKGYCGPVEADVLMKMVDKVQRGEVWAGRRTIGALLEEFYGGVANTPEPTIIESQLEHLTVREREILRLLSNGASNKEIANALNVAVSTIKAHLTRVFRKLGQPDRLRLALYASAAQGSLLSGNKRKDV